MTLAGYAGFVYQSCLKGRSRSCGCGVNGVSPFNMPGMAEARNRHVYTARGPVEGEDWGAVAAVVNERMASRRVGQQELAQLSGVSVSTLRQVQHGAGRRVQNKTLMAISRALGWPEDHLAGILLGGTHAPMRRMPTAEMGTGRERETVETLRRVEEHLADISQRLAAIERAVTTGDVG